jgi:hypothetical protein
LQARFSEDRCEEVGDSPGEERHGSDGEQRGVRVQVQKKKKRDRDGDAHHDHADQQSQAAHYDY